MCSLCGESIGRVHIQEDSEQKVAMKGSFSDNKLHDAIAAKATLLISLCGRD